ncbi:MAG: DUF4154 domain-containing protein [Bacteroidales bacterium]|nr:DUF4154 domain-containing protein [Bacteroidales bacterium]
MKIISKKYYLLFIIIIFNLLNNSVLCQEISDAQLKTAYIYRFARYIEWENEDSIKEFLIGVYDDNPVMFNELLNLTRLRKLKNKPIKVLYFHKSDIITKTHVLYTGIEKNYDIKSVLDKIHGNNTLLVSDNCESQKSVMINFLPMEEGIIHFEINKKNIIDANLTILPKLLLLGGTEIDVRELYREQEKELQSEKDKVEQREIQIASQKEGLQIQKKKILQQSTEIEKQQIQIFEQQNNIKNQKKELSKLLNEVKKQQENLNSKIKILQKQEADINNQENKIKKQQIEIEIHSKFLEKQNANIKIKEQNIKELNTVLEKQIAKIETQQHILYLFIVFIALILSLVFFIFQGYKIKKQANIRLNEKNVAINQQKEEIQTQAEHLEIINKELEKLSIVASKTDNSVVIANANGDIEWVNDGFTRLFGYTLQEFKKEYGSNIAKTSLNPKIREDIKSCIRDKKTIVYSVLNKTKSGKKIWTQTTLTPILNYDRDIEKLVAIDSDITQIKEAEKEIIRQKDQIEEHKNEIEAQRDEIEAQRDMAINQRDAIKIQKQEIMDSIFYAKRIQNAIMPTNEYISNILSNYFILNKPKGIVSGDFYWVSEHNDMKVIALADCTGHGVPGAFMSMLGISFLNKIVNEKNILEPKEILNRLRENVILALHQTGKTGEATDGMDIAVITIDKYSKNLKYSGAMNPIYHIRDNDLHIFNANNMPISIHHNIEDNFTTNSYKLQNNDMIYLFTDGYIDQFGGENNRKFKSKNFKTLLAEISSLPLDEQEKILDTNMLNWQGDCEQIDDILVMGIRI